MGHRTPDIAPSAIDNYIEIVPRHSLTLDKRDIKARMLNAVKNPSGSPVVYDGSVYTQVRFRNGHDRTYFAVSSQANPLLYTELLTLEKYRERCGIEK